MTRDGVPVAGGKITIPIRFQVPKDDRPGRAPAKGPGVRAGAFSFAAAGLIGDAAAH